MKVVGGRRALGTGGNQDSFGGWRPAPACLAVLAELTVGAARAIERQSRRLVRVGQPGVLRAVERHRSRVRTARPDLACAGRRAEARRPAALLVEGCDVGDLNRLEARVAAHDHDPVGTALGAFDRYRSFLGKVKKSDSVTVVLWREKTP